MTLGSAAAIVSLFLAAFGAATILPFQSEFVLVGMIVEQSAPLWLLLLVATIGNVLGSAVNYWMGVFVEHWKDSRWFPVTERQLERVQGWYNRWGVWTLLLSWAPFGDGFTVVAGIMRTPFPLFLLLVTIAKAGRYLALAWAFI